MAHDPRCTVEEAHSDPDCIIPPVGASPIDIPVKFHVWWTDFVANEWTEIVEGPWEDTEKRLRALAEAGAHAGDFGMQVSTRFQDDRIPATLTAEQFFGLDWAQWLD